MTIMFFLFLMSCTDKISKEELFEGYEEEVQKNYLSHNNTPSTDEVLIGQQVWKVENLDVDTFLNGDPILEMKSDLDWETAGNDGIPAWSYFNNEKESSYGKLYNFHAVADPRCLCPEGWRIPTDEDWIRLGLTVSENIAYNLKSKDAWPKDGNGGDYYGFNAKPNGMRYYDGQFFYLNESAFWWTGSSVVLKHAWLRYFDEDYSDRIFRITARRAAGMGVRCMKDYLGEDEIQ